MLSKLMNFVECCFGCFIKTSNDPNASSLDGGNKDNDANIPDLPRSDILNSVNGGDS